MDEKKLFSQHSVYLPLEHDEKEFFESLSLELPGSLSKATPKRKEEFLLGRYCALMALKKAGLVQNTILPINQIDGAPIWPIGHIGSITHTKNFISSIVGSTDIFRGLGLDSQEIMSEKTYQSVHRKILREEEQNLKLDNWSHLELTTLLFSFKESIYKCLRPLCGEFFGFSDAEIIEIKSESKIIKYHLTKDIGNGFGPSFYGQGSFHKENQLIHTIVELKK